MAVAKDESGGAPGGFFGFMSRYPVIFLVLWPAALLALAIAGLSQDDIIEDEVNDIWVPTEGDYKKDKDYEESVRSSNTGSSNFLTLAVSRDSGNLFTASRLAEITARMEAAEATTVEYGGNTYTWDDICAANNAGSLEYDTTYKFPCLRISPMDLFQEANWYFNTTDKETWYDIVAMKNVVNPLIPRFAAITSAVCQGTSSSPGACYATYKSRTDPVYAAANGYPSDHFNPLLLFADIGSFEETHPCKVCIEAEHSDNLDNIEAALQGVVGAVGGAVNTCTLSGSSSAECTEAGTVYAKLAAKYAAGAYDRAYALDYLKHMVTRQLYGQLGAENIINAYNLMLKFGYGHECAEVAGGTCPNPESPLSLLNPTHVAQAGLMALNHADADFSSGSTGGTFFPGFASDGSGLLAGTQNSPFGGSGVDLSGIHQGVLATTAGCLQVLGTTGDADDFCDTNAGDAPDCCSAYPNPAGSPTSYNLGDPTVALDPDQSQYQGFITTDPIYKWMVADVTDVDAHTGNYGPLPSSLDTTAIHTDTSTEAGRNCDLTDDVLQYACGVTSSMSRASYAGLLANVLKAGANQATTYDTPYETDGTRTKLHFAKLWYKMLVDSEGFLDISQGSSDPYTWTLGQGCGYNLKEERFAFTGQSESDILQAASGYIYNVDEGTSNGNIDPRLIIGGSTPDPSTYSESNPLTKVTAIQNIYFALRPKDIVKRVKNCNRDGGVINDLTEAGAEVILEQFKEKFEENWAKGWDTNTGDVQFSAFIDDTGAIGTTGRMLTEITLGGTTLMVISYAVTIFSSVVFLFSTDLVKSKMAVTSVGALLVILAFFAALGLTVIVGISLNVTMGWTLPFIMVGLGMDDMYIILLALKNSGDYSAKSFAETMKEVIIPVTMTSMVNASMFAIMHMSDIPAIYQTATTALFSVGLLYTSMMCCFPAMCYLDMKRSAAQRKDVICCTKASEGGAAGDSGSFLYERVYKPTILGSGGLRTFSHVFVLLLTAALVGISAYGLTQFEVGIGIEDLFPKDSQGGQYATSRSKYLPTWGIAMKWGALDYTNPTTQLKMAKQLENVIATPHVADVETSKLWTADFAAWTTKLCDFNVVQETEGEGECGADIEWSTAEGGDGTYCVGGFAENTLGLRDKIIPEATDPVCYPNKEGICRSFANLHPDDQQSLAGGSDAAAATKNYCPVAATWDTTTNTLTAWPNAKFKFCLEKWRENGGGGGDLELVADTATAYSGCSGVYLRDDEIKVNSAGGIPVSQGPSLFGIKLYTHADTVDLIKETRVHCDDDPDLHCWMTGIAYDYWEQYVNIESFLLEITSVAIATGFVVGALFLLVDLTLRNEAGHSMGKNFFAAVVGALLITIVTILSVLTVVGISTLLDVSLTAFSVMSYILSVGFAVEYSVHITHRFLTAPLNLGGAPERVEFAMKYLFLPCYMAFISSTVGIVCLVFSEFSFIDVFFFRPLIVVMFATYFYGCFFLPVFLSKLNFNVLKVGPKVHRLSIVDGGEQSSSKLEPSL